MSPARSRSAPGGGGKPGRAADGGGQRPGGRGGDRKGGRPARAVLRRPLAQAIRAGQPWLYRQALELPPGLPDGAVVDVVDAGGRFLARGIHDAASPIAVRVWTTAEEERVDAELVAARLASAWALRRATLDLGRVTAFRLVNGEGDRLPGLVCDVYDDTAVVQLDTPAVGWLVPHLGRAVAATVPGLAGVVLKPRRGEAAGPGDGLSALVGELPAGERLVREYDWCLLADLERGHKTGLYLDQRESRRLVHGLAAGRRVLNLFSYTGGFGVAAALGGAPSVVSVDIGGPVMAAARRNFAANGLDPAAHGFVVADVFEHLDRETERHDLVIVDPPSMAASASGLERALRAYVRLNAQALGRVADGGLLFTASCSTHVSEADLQRVLAEAAARARRQVRVLVRGGAGADHPTLPAMPEGRVLKTLLAWVE